MRPARKKNVHPPTPDRRVGHREEDTSALCWWEPFNGPIKVDVNAEAGEVR